MILLAWNAITCLAISLVCWSYLLSSRSETRLAMTMNVGLLLLAVGTFVSAFAPVVRDHDAGWWAVFARSGGAIVAAVLYERRFGVRAQARALIEHLRAWATSWRQTAARLHHAWQVITHRGQHQ